MPYELCCGRADFAHSLCNGILQRAYLHLEQFDLESLRGRFKLLRYREVRYICNKLKSYLCGQNNRLKVPELVAAHLIW